MKMTNKISIYKIPKNLWTLGFGILLGFGIWGLGFNNVFAARFYFEVPRREFKVGEVIPVRVLVNTEGEDVNAINLKVDYSKDFLALESVNNANSIINFWVDNLVGVAIGGYRGSGGLVSQLNLKALRIGSTIVSFTRESEVYLNDGLGTRARVNLDKEVILKIGEGMSPPPPATTDTEPPEDFNPIIARSPDVFNNQYFLIFSTQDKGSGIDYYEAQETRQKSPSPTNWTRSSSPLLLTNQGLTYYIFVKAIDGSGNQRIVGLRPQFEEQAQYPQWLRWVVPLMALVLILVTFVIIRLRRSGRQVEK